MILMDHICRSGASGYFGGFFLRPLVGLVSLLRNLLSVILSGKTDSPLEERFLALRIPALYMPMDAIVWIIGYGIALVRGPRLMPQYGARTVQALGLITLEQALVVLGLAGFLITMLAGFTTDPQPLLAGLMFAQPLLGLSIEALGLLLLIVVTLAMKARLARD